MTTYISGHTVRINTILEVVFDFGFVILGILIATVWVGNGLPVDFAVIVVYAAIMAVTMLALNAWLGFYQRIHDRTVEDSRARAVLSLHLSIPIAYFLIVVLPIAEVNRQLIEISGMAGIFGMLTNRVLASHRRDRSLVVHRILILGVGEEAMRVAESLHKEDSTVRIVGFYPGSTSEKIGVPESNILSRDLALCDVVSDKMVDEIVVAIGERRGGRMPLRELLDCRVTGVSINDVATHYERVLGQIRLDALRAGWLIFGEGFRQGKLRTATKRVFDLACALILLILASPVMVVAAILILIEDGFPILYRQERVGFNGRLFNVIKFRSMRRDAEADGQPRWATTNDDRVTRVGRVLRKLRIDELPQLFSVLRGDMSMVGPRPERAFFVDQLTEKIPFYAIRHSVKPGVTGWAQVRYHYGASADDAAQKLQYDLYYVKNHSLFLDLVVVFETVGVVLGGKGAQ